LQGIVPESTFSYMSIPLAISNMREQQFGWEATALNLDCQQSSQRRSKQHVLMGRSWLEAALPVPA
jgi:hypothetical protein